MSRKQWVVLVALAAAALVVFGCLGCYSLTFFTSTAPADRPDATQTGNTPTAPTLPTPSPTQTHTPLPPTAAPTDTATPTPEETPTPQVEEESTATQTPEATPTPQPMPTPTAPAIGSQDLAYLRCANDVMLDGAEIAKDIAVAAYVVDYGFFCSEQRGWTTRTALLWRTHDACPLPSSETLEWAWVYLDEALLQMGQGTAAYGKYCEGNPLDYYWLDRGTEHLQEANRYLELATEKFAEYGSP